MSALFLIQNSVGSMPKFAFGMGLFRHWKVFAEIPCLRLRCADSRAVDFAASLIYPYDELTPLNIYAQRMWNECQLLDLEGVCVRPVLKQYPRYGRWSNE